MRAIRDKLVCLVLIFSLIISVTGCGRGTGTENSAPVVHKKTNVITFRSNLYPPPATLDPHRAKTESEILLTKCIYDTLFEKENGKIIDGLAERWTYSEDGKKLTVHLKKGVKFHNGAPLTAEDVEFSLKRAAGYFREQNQSYGIDFSGLRENIVIEDNDTLSIYFSSPSFNFHEVLSLPVFSIVHKKTIENYPDYGRPGGYFSPVVPVVGTGPYRFVEWIDGQFLVLASNPNYHKKTSNLERLEFRLYNDLSIAVHDFIAYDLDAIILDGKNYLEVIKEYPELKDYTEKFLTGTKYYLGFNLDKKPFDRWEARDAVVKALDAEKIEKDADGAIKPLEGLGKGDARAAKKVLDRLGDDTDSGNDKKSLEVVLGFSEGDVQRTIGESIKKQLEALGMEVALRKFSTDSEAKSLANFFILKLTSTAEDFKGQELKNEGDKDSSDAEGKENEILIPIGQRYDYYCVHKWVKFAVDQETGLIDFLKTKKDTR
ncbi:MAG: ABC transporter substrate-binding protein [Clostridia bacterium]|nr:ABC transporter substrate-binding protein [Clostridia bacterium]